MSTLIGTAPYEKVLTEIVAESLHVLTVSTT